VGDLVREIEDQRAGASSPLSRVSAAVLTAEHLAAVGDDLVDHFVQEARRAGASWSDIGACLGVSKQAAQKRFVPERADEPEGPAGLEPQARQVVRRAEEEARAVGHRYIGTEHLLLGLLSVPGRTAALLAEAGVTLEGARQRALAKVGTGSGAPGDRLPITPRARKVLELAQREAHRAGVEAAGPDHVLLGLISEGRGVAAQVLAELTGDLPGLAGRLRRS
jgi:hypothetical protein